MTYRIVNEDTNEVLNSYSDRTTLGEIREWLEREGWAFGALVEHDNIIEISVYKIENKTPML